MTANPLAVRLETAERSKTVTKEMLEGMVARYNQKSWVIYSEKPYFLNKKLDDDGKTIHFLDRVI